jgi:hypothetical protein
MMKIPDKSKCSLLAIYSAIKTVFVVGRRADLFTGMPHTVSFHCKPNYEAKQQLLAANRSTNNFLFSSAVASSSSSSSGMRNRPRIVHTEERDLKIHSLTALNRAAAAMCIFRTYHGQIIKHQSSAQL